MARTSQHLTRDQFYTLIAELNKRSMTSGYLEKIW